MEINSFIKISLIIPVYNVEKYLRECLHSCVNQTLKDIEIICVNDCSPDNSDVILNEYAAKDKRVKVINHETNKGLGGARNTGIANATGEYIWFVDSDDFIDSNACEILYDIASKNKIDILSFGSFVFYDDDFNKRHYEVGDVFFEWKKNTVIEFQEKKDLSLNIVISGCWFIVKTSFSKKYRFREGVYFEDTDYFPILLYESSSMMCINYPAYYTRKNPDSITRSRRTEKKVRDMISVLDNLRNYIEKEYVPKKSFLYMFYLNYMKYVVGVIDKDWYYLWEEKSILFYKQIVFSKKMSIKNKFKKLLVLGKNYVCNKWCL